MNKSWFFLIKSGTFQVKNTSICNEILHVVYLKNGEITVGKILICLKTPVLFLATLTLDYKVHFSTLLLEKWNHFYKRL